VAVGSTPAPALAPARRGAQRTVHGQRQIGRSGRGFWSETAAVPVARAPATRRPRRQRPPHIPLTLPGSCDELGGRGGLTLRPAGPRRRPRQPRLTCVTWTGTVSAVAESKVGLSNSAVDRRGVELGDHKVASTCRVHRLFHGNGESDEHVLESGVDLPLDTPICKLIGQSGARYPYKSPYRGFR